MNEMKNSNMNETKNYEMRSAICQWVRSWWSASDLQTKTVEEPSRTELNKAKFRIRELETYYGITKWVPEIQEDPTKAWELVGKQSWHVRKEDAMDAISNHKINVLDVRSEKIHEVE